MMIIDTPEAARNLEKAFYDAEKRGPLKFEGESVEDMLKRGEEIMKNNPELLREAAEKARKRIIERGEDPDLLVWDDTDE